MQKLFSRPATGALCAGVAFHSADRLQGAVTAAVLYRAQGTTCFLNDSAKGNWFYIAGDKPCVGRFVTLMQECSGNTFNRCGRVTFECKRSVGACCTHLSTDVAMLVPRLSATHSPGSQKEGFVRINKKCTFLPSIVGSFCCNCRNGLWLSVHKGERHAKQ